MTEYLTKVMGYSEENVVTFLNEHATNVDLAKYFEKWLWNNVEKTVLSLSIIQATARRTQKQGTPF